VQVVIVGGEGEDERANKNASNNKRASEVMLAREKIDLARLCRQILHVSSWTPAMMG
jgi:hypothetical protein